MVQDIGIIENDDLLFENGDLVARDSDIQHIKDILYSEKGDYKINPLIGVGILSYLNGSIVGLESEIKKQLTDDGFDNIVTEVKGNNLTKLNAFRR